MNRNRRGNQYNRNHNRSRNRQPPNRLAHQQQQQYPTNVPPIQQDNPSDVQAQTQSPIDANLTTSGRSRRHQQDQQPQQEQQPHSVYSETYPQPQQSHQSADNYGGQQINQPSQLQNQEIPTCFQQSYMMAPPPPPEMAHYNQGLYIPSGLDEEANNLYSNVQCSLMRSIDSSYAMPISEHVFYSSYESYDAIMIEQRRQLNELMSQISECAERPFAPDQYDPNSSLAAPDQRLNVRVDFGALEDMQDKYDTMHEYSEQMYDRIGHNLDEASGLTQENAKLIQATLEAANRNKLNPSSSSMQAHQQVSVSHHAQIPQQQTELSSSSSSSSLTTRPSDTSSPLIYNQHQQLHQQQQLMSSNETVEYQPQHPKQQQGSSGYLRQSHANIIQPSALQNQQRGQPGGYMGKQYGSPYYQRFSMRENKNIPRPQDSFKDEIDNSYSPFRPLLNEKPNSIVPLNVTLDRIDEHGNEHYSHPYEIEINSFTVPDELLIYRDPIEPTDFNLAPIVLVETVEQLEEMCQTIEKEKEIAVDVEHHSYRSYQGITCLLQISTRAQDFVIDAIKLRTHLQRLNRSFTNPEIIKVFHGADCDILWLQRDFGIYVVNLFDTSRAAKLMKFAHLSLAFLIKHYCNFEVDKSYQLADWRERPLPLPMIQYARADTHFLLYIYDRLRNDLLMKDKSNKDVGKEYLRSVFTRCNEICLKRYEKPPYSEKSHLSVLRKSKSTFNAKQMYAFKEMYKWRDNISRKLDESVGYVLPNNLMIRIAEYLPREPQGITALCNPVPPTLKKYLNDVHAIILKALEIPLDEASKIMSGGNPLTLDPSLRSIDLDSINHKQDIAHAVGLQEGEFEGILDTFYQLRCDDSYGNNEQQQRTNNWHQSGYQRYPGQQGLAEHNYYVNNLNRHPSRLYNFLDTTPHNEVQRREAIKNVHESVQKQFVSPYYRYESRNK